MKTVDLETAKEIGNKLGVDWDKIEPEQFRAGMDIEFEHGKKDPETDVTHDNPIATGKITWQHLKESPDYYKKLKKVEGAWTMKAPLRRKAETPFPFKKNLTFQELYDRIQTADPDILSNEGVQDFLFHNYRLDATDVFLLAHPDLAAKDGIFDSFENPEQAILTWLQETGLKKYTDQLPKKWLIELRYFLMESVGGVNREIALAFDAAFPALSPSIPSQKDLPKKDLPKPDPSFKSKMKEEGLDLDELGIQSKLKRIKKFYAANAGTWVMKPLLQASDYYIYGYYDVEDTKPHFSLMLVHTTQGIIDYDKGHPGLLWDKEFPENSSVKDAHMEAMKAAEEFYRRLLNYTPSMLDQVLEGQTEFHKPNPEFEEDLKGMGLDLPSMGMQAKQQRLKRIADYYSGEYKDRQREVGELLQAAMFATGDEGMAAVEELSERFGFSELDLNILQDSDEILTDENFTNNPDFVIEWLKDTKFKNYVEELSRPFVEDLIGKILTLHPHNSKVRQALVNTFSGFIPGMKAPPKEREIAKPDPKFKEEMKSQDLDLEGMGIKAKLKRIQKFYATVPSEESGDNFLDALNQYLSDPDSKAADAAGEDLKAIYGLTDFDLGILLNPFRLADVPKEDVIEWLRTSKLYPWSKYVPDTIVADLTKILKDQGHLSNQYILNHFVQMFGTRIPGAKQVPLEEVFPKSFSEEQLKEYEKTKKIPKGDPSFKEKMKGEGLDLDELGIKAKRKQIEKFYSKTAAIKDGVWLELQPLSPILGFSLFGTYDENYDSVNVDAAYMIYFLFLVYAPNNVISYEKGFPKVLWTKEVTGQDLMDAWEDTSDEISEEAVDKSTEFYELLSTYSKTQLESMLKKDGIVPTDPAFKKKMEEQGLNLGDLGIKASLKLSSKSIETLIKSGTFKKKANQELHPIIKINGEWIPFTFEINNEFFAQSTDDWAKRVYNKSFKEWSNEEKEKYLTSGLLAKEALSKDKVVESVYVSKTYADQLTRGKLQFKELKKDPYSFLEIINPALLKGFPFSNENIEHIREMKDPVTKEAALKVDLVHYTDPGLLKWIKREGLKSSEKGSLGEGTYFWVSEPLTIADVPAGNIALRIKPEKATSLVDMEYVSGLKPGAEILLGDVSRSYLQVLTDNGWEDLKSKQSSKEAAVSTYHAIFHSREGLVIHRGGCKDIEKELRYDSNIYLGEVTANSLNEAIQMYVDDLNTPEDRGYRADQFTVKPCVRKIALEAVKENGWLLNPFTNFLVEYETKTKQKVAAIEDLKASLEKELKEKLPKNSDFVIPILSGSIRIRKEGDDTSNDGANYFIYLIDSEDNTRLAGYVEKVKAANPSNLINFVISNPYIVGNAVDSKEVTE